MQDSGNCELVCERSLAKTAAMLAGCIALTGISYFCISRRICTVAFEGWLLGAMLGPVGILANGVALFLGGPQVVFDKDGILDRRTFGFIPWTEIFCTQVGSFASDRFLCLYLVDESARWSALSMWGRLGLRVNRVRGCPRFIVRFKGLRPGMQEAWDYLENHHSDKILTAVPTPTPAADRT